MGSSFQHLGSGRWIRLVRWNVGWGANYSEMGGGAK